MTPETRKRLLDIQDAGSGILAWTRGDPILIAASRYKFVIIGEALVKVRAAEPAVLEEIGEWKRIIAFRNQLVHQYALIRNDVTWRIIQAKLPILHHEVAALLEEAEQQ